MKRVLATAFAALLAGPAGAAAQPCSVDWKDVYGAASQRGMSFGFKVHRGLGECFVHKSAFVVSAASGSELTCELHLFAGMSLSAGWKLSLLSDSGLPFVVAPPGTEQANLKWLVSTTTPGTTVNFVPKRLEFNAESTPCKDWLVALARP